MGSRPQVPNGTAERARELAHLTDRDERIAVLARTLARPDDFDGVWIAAKPDAAGYAHDLYAHLRSLDAADADAMLVEAVPDEPAWLAVRDRLRPEFRVFTGNDLAIDMVMYGSDYLLGLSTFAPEAFALRDRMWANEDPRFHELNDLLQYLGHFTFRAPVPGYRHDAAMAFELRGWASSSTTPSG